MPFSAEYHAAGREAELAADQIGIGVTALGKAGYGSGGIYTRAFFGLSIGLERLAKLIIIADYAIDHDGRFPGNTVLKRAGHDLKSLLNKCDTISQTRGLAIENPRPVTSIHTEIIETLTEFAVRSRYYNLDFLADSEPRAAEPIAAWWNRVGEAILTKHYAKRTRERDERIARLLGGDLESVTSVLFFDETGQTISDPTTMLLRSATNRVVQKYSRLYVLQIVRWLCKLLAELVHIAAERRISALAGLDEYFRVYPHQSDKDFLRRKTWPGL